MIRRPTLFGTLAIATLWFTAAAARAETSPYYIGATQAFSYDSNVFRLTDAQAKGSTWGSTGLVAGFDEKYRRQHFFGSANVQSNYYQQLKELNNTSYALNGGWDWATIEHLSGSMNLSFSQNLGNYGGETITGIRERNIQNNVFGFASADYGLPSLMVLHGRVGYSRVQYSAPLYAQYELEQQNITLGVRRQFSGQLTLGTGVAYTKGSYFSIGRDFDRYDLYVTETWVATGQSTLSSRLNYSSWDYSGLQPYSTSGVTGWVRWDYVPTGKLSFNALLGYDTLANSGLTDYGGATPNYLGDTSQLTSSIRLGAKYQATAKIDVNATVDYYRRNYDQSVNPFPGQPPGNLAFRDQVTAATLGVDWTPTRNWLVACNLNRYTRTQSSDQPIVLMPYSAWGASCSAQFAIQ